MSIKNTQRIAIIQPQKSMTVKFKITSFWNGNEGAIRERSLEVPTKIGNFFLSTGSNCRTSREINASLFSLCSPTPEAKTNFVDLVEIFKKCDVSVLTRPSVLYPANLTVLYSSD